MEGTISGWFVLLLGMGTVLVGLVCLIFIAKLMSLACKGAGKKKGAADPALTPAQAPAAGTPACAIENRPQFVAAVSAAIATAMGTDVTGIRIHSIRPAGATPGRGELVAAVSAAIATEMGTTPSGLRIHSIRQI